MTATSAFFTLLGTSIVRNSHNFSQIRPIKFTNFFLPPSLRFQRYRSSAAILESEAFTNPNNADSGISTHPWPEWISFVDRLKTKGYLIQKSGDEGTIDYTEMNLLKEACLSFARDRYDIFKSLSTQDIQTIVEKGCPNLFRKAVNSAKRLRVHLELDESDTCGSCNLRGSCDRAYILLNETEASARTVDIVRLLILYALDPLVISGDKKPPGRDLIEASARKLLSELIELGETPLDPELPKPTILSTLKKKKSIELLDKGRISNVETKPGDWLCKKCNFNNFARNVQCRGCGEDATGARGPDVEMKRGDWICTECSFMNFAKNMKCLKCRAEGPKSVSVNDSEMKKGDWNCPGCTFMNFASNRKCFRCQEPRPQRQLRPGDWECPDCDFLNYGRNSACKKCNLQRPRQENANNQYEEQTWKKPY